MTVKEVLSLAAADMGREDLEAAVLNATEASGELASLLRCYNLVENEIALDYFPLKAEETLSVENGKIAYSQFSYAPVNIYKAVCGGFPVRWELYPDRVAFPSVESGAVTVSYSYSPMEKAWDGEAEFSDKISARLLSYGVAGEFCLSSGQYSEAAMWERKYRDALKAANIVRRKLSMRPRRWV